MEMLTCKLKLPYGHVSIWSSVGLFRLGSIPNSGVCAVLLLFISVQVCR